MAVPSIPVPAPGTRGGRGADDRETGSPADPVAHARREAGAHDWSWAWQAITGGLVLVLATVHMVAQHFVVPEGLRDYAAVVAWLANPLVVAVEVAFLVTVTWHGLLGLRAVLFDLGLSPRTERWLTRGLVAVWIATVGYGVWLTSVIVGQT
jgi:succinate dehydrogenase hydrophobic anchor subunit